MKYINRPVVIEAIKLGWDTWNEICDFVPLPYFQGGCYLDDETFEKLPDNKSSNTMGLCILTRDGVVIARQGDYIIKGVDGGFDIRTSDIFDDKYERIMDDMSPTQKRAFLIYGTNPALKYGIEVVLVYSTDKETAKILYSGSIEKFNKNELGIIEVQPGNKEEIVKEIFYYD